MSSSDCSVGRHSSDKPVEVVQWEPIKNKARKVLRNGSELHQESYMHQQSIVYVDPEC